MLTLEDINILQEGDEITYYYKGTVHKIDSDNWIYLEDETGVVFSHEPKECVHMSLGEIPTKTTPTQYDPCRRLKCGDIVELVEWNGRFPIPKSYFEDIDIKTFRVVAEECRGIVTIDICGQTHSIPICFIKHITPVEELEPYHILHNVANGYVIYKNEPKTDNIVVVFNKTHPNAKSAAEAECKRLNDEYRKEHGNDLS